jgi:hypothetical protein
MEIKEMFWKLRRHEITYFDALNTALNLTQKDPSQIQLLMDEISFYINCEEVMLQKEISSFLHTLFDKGLTKEAHGHLMSKRQKFIFDKCSELNIKSFEDLPRKKPIDGIDYESIFYLFEFDSLWKLRKDLSKYIHESQQNTKEFINPLAVNPIEEMEIFINKYYNFFLFINSHSPSILDKYPDVETQSKKLNLIIDDSSKRYLPKGEKQAEAIDNSINTLKGFFLNSEQRQIEAFQKIVSGEIQNSREELDRINDFYTKNHFSEKIEFLSHYCSDWITFEKRYNEYFEGNKATKDNPESKEKKVTKDINKTKGYVNQLTHEQKEFIDELIKDGFIDSHVYCELKTNQIITLTESQFVDYLNQFHEKKYQKSKRFTSSKNLSIPIELSKKVTEFKSKITKK